MRVAGILLLCIALRGPLSARTDDHEAASVTVDKVVVHKRERKLMLMNGHRLLKSYRISLGANPVGAKIRQGDRKTPEGSYTLDWHNDHSQYHRSIHISYPNAADRARAHRLGFLPGGDTYLHGLPNGYRQSANEPLNDWTDGCIAVTNAEIDEIYHLVADGTPIEIKP